MKTPFLKIFLWTALFSTLCAEAYIHRGDFYHKQTDQFYYLSVADSVRTYHTVTAQVDPTLPSQPRTLNTGVTWIMLPFSDMKIDVLFPLISLLFVLLNLSTIFPLYRLCVYFGLGEKLTSMLLITYFTSFPITLLKIWPVNEGPSLLLATWFLYFIFVKPRGFLFLPLAFLAPIFRSHILIEEIALIFFALVRKKKGVFFRSSLSLAASFLGILTYRALIPYLQSEVGPQVNRGITLSSFTSDFFSAVTHIFVPETLTKTLFSPHGPETAALLGGVILLFIFGSFRNSLKKWRSSDILVVSFFMVAFNLLALAFWPAVISRFLAPSYFWMLVPLFLALAPYRGLQKIFFVGFVAFNFAVVLAYTFSHSTDPNFQVLENLKFLSTKAENSEVIYYPKDFPAHNRQIYGYFRLPMKEMTDESHLSLAPHYGVLTVKSPPEIPASCQKTSFTEGAVTLTNVSCPIGPVLPHKTF